MNLHLKGFDDSFTGKLRSTSFSSDNNVYWIFKNYEISRSVSNIFWLELMMEK